MGTAASLTTLTCMCLVGTTLTTMSQEAQKMKTIHFSGSYGGIILQQAVGSRSEQRATCPQSWHQCQVKHCVFSTSEHFTSVYTLLVFHTPTPPQKKPNQTNKKKTPCMKIKFGVAVFLQLFCTVTTSWCLGAPESPLVKIMATTFTFVT